MRGHLRSRRSFPRHEEPVELYYSRLVVPERGFRWTSDLVASPDINQSWAPPPYLVIEEGWGQPYHPLKENPALHRDFAQLASTESDILEFANKYGWLGVGLALTPPGGGVVNSGESRFHWIKEIRQLRAAIDLWDWLRNRDERELGKHICWHHTEGFVSFQHDDWGEEIIGRKEVISPREYAKWAVPELYRPARLWLAKTVNKKLEEAQPALVIVRDTGNDYELEPMVQPRNLLSAMWLLLYQEMIGQRRFVRCEVCGEWMDVTDNRASKRMHNHCAARLRKQRYRARTREQSEQK